MHKIITFILSFTSLFLILNISKLSAVSSNSQTSISPKVFVIIYNPVLRTKRFTKIIDYKHWNNPNTLIEQYISDVRQASHNIVNYQIAGQIELNDIPQKHNGYDYTAEGILDCLEGRGPCNGPEYTDFANYQKILQTNRICEKVNRGEVDELWLFGATRFGFYEANMAGKDAFWTNGPVVENTMCQRPIHIMGYNYELGVANILHDLGHRIEGTLDHFIGYQKNSTGFGWGDFRSKAGCGDTHFPPNTNQAYQYDNQSAVLSNCNDWLNYPNFTNQKDLISCSIWNCFDGDYFKWWFFHIPYAEGTDSNGKLNNWWYYIANLPEGQPPTPTNSPTPTVTPTPEISSPLPLPSIRWDRPTIPTLSFPYPISITPTPSDSPAPTPNNVRSHPTISFPPHPRRL